MSDFMKVRLPVFELLRADGLARRHVASQCAQVFVCATAAPLNLPTATVRLIKCFTEI
jgi:hypothetical protein